MTSLLYSSIRMGERLDAHTAYCISIIACLHNGGVFSCLLFCPRPINLSLLACLFRTDIHCTGIPRRFLENMPASYFRQTTEEARLQHLGAIAAMLEEQPLVRAWDKRVVSRSIIFRANGTSVACAAVLLSCDRCTFGHLTATFDS